MRDGRSDRPITVSSEALERELNYLGLEVINHVIKTTRDTTNFSKHMAAHMSKLHTQAKQYEEEIEYLD